MPDINDNYYAVSYQESVVRLSEEDGRELTNKLAWGNLHGEDWYQTTDIFGSPTLLRISLIENICLETPETTRAAIEWSHAREVAHEKAVAELRGQSWD